MRHLPSARAQSSAPPPPRRSRRGRSRRGTVLLFALGVLAVISIAALSYVTLVRVDRQASSAVAKTVGYDRQVGGVIDTIGGLLAADLFGNKLVTTDVPSDLNPRTATSTPIWPRMFEDGEFRDYPFTNFATFNLNLPGKTPKGANVNWVLKLDESAPPDDAWLSSLDPMWFQPGTVTDKTHWRQISNLRSVYTYDTNGTPNDFADDRWIRGDGKFVDLGQLFLDYRTIGSEERGNPGTNLLDRTILGVNSADGPVMPRAAAGNVTTAPFVPMNFASRETGMPALDPRDERFWADTDGDLRADARWQLIDSLGNREGLLWVTAARIVDLSAMVNVNASIEGGYPTGTVDDYAEGRTPADIDLYRLLLNDQNEFNTLTPGRVFNWGTTTQHGYPQTNKLSGLGATNGGTFSDHLINRLHVYDLMQELTDPDPSVPNFKFSSSNWYWEPKTSNKRLTWTQRLAMWNDVGSAPGRGPTITTPRGPVQPGYALSTMIDLHAFAGANNRSMLTELEEAIDGPDEALGYLPRPEDQPNTSTGPMRSNTRPGDTRVFPGNPNGTDTKPRADQLRVDPRRYLTTVSGVSDVSPVPVLNFKAVAWDGNRPYYSQFSNRKVRLSDFSVASVPDAYQAFVWALAPLATDEYLTAYTQQNFGFLPGDNVSGATIAAPAQPNAVALQPSYHYGGEDFAPGPSPARDLLTSGNPAAVQYGPQSGAAFPTITAGALAINLADASDADANPTVARLLVTDDPRNALASRVVGGKALLGTRFSQGDIPPRLLPTTAAGNLATNIKGLEQAIDTSNTAGIDDWMQNVTNVSAGLTMVGLERHPYITEVFAFALFDTPPNSSVINTSDKTRQVGAVLAIEVQNPYTDGIKIDTNYEFVLMRRDKTDLAETGAGAPLRLSPQESVTIGAESSMTFVYTYGRPGDAQYFDVLGMGVIDDPDGDMNAADSIEDRVRGLAGTNGRVKRLRLATDSEQMVTDNPTFVMPFARERVRIALRRTVPELSVTGITNSGKAVVDYFETDALFCDFPAAVSMTDASLNFDTGYFTAIGYDLTFPNPSTSAFLLGQIAGRVGMTCSVTRPVNSDNFGDFPKYVVASRPTDSEVYSAPATQWFAHAWLHTVPDGSPGDSANFNAATGLAPRQYLLDAPVVGHPAASIAELALVSDLNSPNDKRADISPVVPDRGIGAGWQLFVPSDGNTAGVNGASSGRPLRYVSELHQLCTFAHLCKNNDIDNIEAWTTVGQQLRESLRWDLAKTTGDGLENDNPYLGTLDPTRYIPTDNSALFESGITRDESLALPLALRVFDCFEALEPAESLAQGRINLNTAPERVLQVLPFVAPADSNVLPTPTNDRVRFIAQYRDAWDPDFGVDYLGYSAGTLLQLGSNVFNNFGAANIIRRHDQSHDPNLNGPNVQYPYTAGFATAGELAFLDIWGDRGAVNQTFGASPQGFAYPLGVNTTDDGSGNKTNLRLFEGEVGANVNADGITDDPEERLALYRAVSNIVSSRSDVYGAWFILRGYDPKIIEAIKVDPTDAIEAMNDSTNPFTPAYESRWFVVFDRSNVRKPTDRPRVLLKAQLPSSRP